MQRLGVEQHAVKIEEDSVIPRHQEWIFQPNMRFRLWYRTGQKRMPNEAELQAEIERLRAENESLKRPRGQTSMRVSEKGALSVYGLGRFPVTLYREQWEKLLAMADEIRQFIQENDRLLKRKE